MHKYIDVDEFLKDFMDCSTSLYQHSFCLKGKKNKQQQQKTKMRRFGNVRSESSTFKQMIVMQ